MLNNMTYIIKLEGYNKSITLNQTVQFLPKIIIYTGKVYMLANDDPQTKTAVYEETSSLYLNPIRPMLKN